MSPPNGEALEAIKRLAARPEGQIVLGYLQQVMSDTNKRLACEHDAVALRTLQGQAQTLTVLLAAWKP